MNRKVLIGSALLLTGGILVGFLPAPASWVAPVLVVSAWLVVVVRRPQPVEGAPVVAAPPPVQPTVEVEVREVVPGGLTDELYRYRATIDLLRDLKTLVVNDTEAAVIRLTGALFTLVQNSQEVSLHIEKSLDFLSDGESGLGKTLGNLETQLHVFDSLDQRFSQLKDALTGDIEALTKTVGSINQFSSTLTDLADQTNVLAINASIEAARVGIHGRGFAVIATQVQALAKNSKDIADKMARTVRDVVSSVEASFARQIQRIQDSEALIVNSEAELRRWAGHVNPQMATVGSMIGEARQLASVVTKELGDVTVSLQFQDRTKQILDHIDGVLVEISEKLVRSSGLEVHSVPPGLRAEALESASKLFTIREEWDLVADLRSGFSRSPKSIELF